MNKSLNREKKKQSTRQFSKRSGRNFFQKANDKHMSQYNVHPKLALSQAELLIILNGIALAIIIIYSCSELKLQIHGIKIELIVQTVTFLQMLAVFCWIAHHKGHTRLDVLNDINSLSEYQIQRHIGEHFFVVVKIALE